MRIINTMKTIEMLVSLVAQVMLEMGYSVMTRQGSLRIEAHAPIAVLNRVMIDVDLTRATLVFKLDGLAENSIVNEPMVALRDELIEVLCFTAGIAPLEVTEDGCVVIELDDLSGDGAVDKLKRLLAVTQYIQLKAWLLHEDFTAHRAVHEKALDDLADERTHGEYAPAPRHAPEGVASIEMLFEDVENDDAEDDIDY